MGGRVYTFDEFATIEPYRDIIKWQANTGSARLGMREMRFNRGTVDNPPAKGSVLILYRQPAQISHSIHGKRRPTRKFLPGDMVLRPANMRWTSHFEDPAEVTSFGLSDDIIQSATASFGADVSETIARLDMRPIRSPLVEGLAKQLSDGAHKGFDRLYFDALTQAMIHELWRIAGGPQHTAENAAGKLQTSLVKRLEELIVDTPGKDLTIDKLAKAADMSLPAFTSAVKETTGQTPYQFVLSRRIALARDLIETTELNLSQISFRCGFSSQSHMTDVFRAKLGVSPGKLRADRR